MSATAKVENATAKQEPTEGPASEQSCKVSDVSSCREAAEEEKDLKRYVFVPWKKNNEQASAEEEEAVIDDLFGHGHLFWFGRSRQEMEKFKDMLEDWRRVREMEMDKMKKKMGMGEEEEAKIKMNEEEEMEKFKDKLEEGSRMREMAMDEMKKKMGWKEEKENKSKIKMKEEEEEEKENKKINMNEEKEKEKEDEEEIEKLMEKMAILKSKRQVMTPKLQETWEKYARQVRESEGFDFVDFPGCSSPSWPPITPYYFIEDKWLSDVCRIALAEFNSLNGTRFEFVKVEKANTKPCAGYVVFVTFQAGKPATDSLVTFQARAYHRPFPRGQPLTKIHFCRIKKDAKGPMDSKLDQGTKSDGEAQDEAALDGPSESHSLTIQRL